MRVKDVVGRYGEDLAVAHLQRAGLEVLERNWRCRDGELDVVARDGATLVFCEVKARSGAGYGVPAEAVTAAKGRRLRRLAARWLTERRPAFTGLRFTDVRFDVVGVLRTPGGVEVEHLRAVL